MKSIYLALSLVFISTIGAYAQKNMNDTIINNKYIRSSWAINYGIGVIVPHQPQNFTAWAVGQSVHFSVQFKDFMFFENVSFYGLTAKRDFVMNNLAYKKSSSFIVGQINFGFGYCYDFHKNWGLQARIAYANNMYSTNNTNTLSSNGGVFGLGLSRYIHLGRFNYLVITANYNYNSTNSRDLCASLDNNYSDFTFILSYKGWFRKALK